MKKKKVLILLSLLFLCFLVLLISTLLLILFREDISEFLDAEDSTEVQTEEEVNEEEVDQIEASTPVYFIANCALYTVEDNQEVELEFVNNTDVDCFEKTTFRGNYALLNPHHDTYSDNPKNYYRKFLLDTKALEINEIEYDEEKSFTSAYNEKNDKLYTYVSRQGLFEGSITNPTSQQIFSIDPVIYGRGGAIYDDFAIRISPDGDKLMIIDTIPSESADGDVFYTLKVVDLEGEILYSDYATFGKWINNSNIVYKRILIGPDRSNDTVVYNLDNDTENTLDVPARVYDIDAIEGIISVGYFEGEGGSIENLRTKVFNTDDYALVYEIDQKLGSLAFIDSNKALVKTVLDCTGYSDTSDEAYPCPMDGPVSYYEDSIGLYDLENETLKQLVEYDEASFPSR